MTETFTLSTISEVLREKNLELPPEFVVFELYSEGRITEEKKRSRFLAEKRYLLDKEDISKSAKKMLERGYLLCVSTDLAKNGKIPTIDAVLEALIRFSKHNIILAAPYISPQFVSDIQGVLEEKKDIAVMITNDENSSLALDNQGATIKKIRGMGFRVITARRDVHAKIYLFDERIALIGSSNLTRNGFFRNSEIEVVIFGDGCKAIRKILENL